MATRVAFAVPGWLEGWWNLMVPFTAAIHWPAWAAIFTFLALLNTARIADRANRTDRRRDALLVYAAARQLDYAVTTFETYVDGQSRGPMSLVAAQATVNFFSNKEYSAKLDDVEEDKFPTVFAYRRFRHAVHTLENMLGHFGHAIDEKKIPDPSFVSEKVANVQQDISKLIDHARSMISRSEWQRIQDKPDASHGLAHSLKSLPSKLRATWTALPFAKSRQRASTDEKG